MEKTKKARKQLFSLVLALAMVLTSVSIPSVTAEAAKTVAVKKVQITNPKKKKVTLNKGKTLQIKVKITPKNVKNKKVTYKSSKKKIASVTAKGKVKGLKVGTAKITVTSKANKKKKATLTVQVVTPVSKVTVNPTSATIDAGATTTLTAAVEPKNAYNKKVNWSTSNANIATVDTNGVVKGVSAGTATITATAADGSNKKATCQITVKAAAVNPGPNPPAATATLESIAVTKAPDKTEYVVGDMFDPTGMEVTATYSDTKTKVLESTAYQLTPSAETALKTSNKTVTVSYTEGDITQTATTPITVKAKPTVKEITIKTQPTKTEYMEGDTFDPAGMVVEAKLSDDTTKVLEAGEGGYTYSTDPLEVTVGAATSNVTISYVVSSSKTLTADVPVTVKAQNPLKSIAVVLKKTTLEREDATFNDDDVTVTATFEDNTTKPISVEDCIVDPNPFTKADTSATVSYWYGGIKKDATVSGFVVTSYRETYTFENENTVGTLVKRENESGDAVPVPEYATGIDLNFVDNGVNGKALKMDGTYGLRLDKIAGTESKSYSISMWVKPEVMAENKALIISTASQFGLGGVGSESWCALAGNNNTTLKLWSYGEDYKHDKAVITPITSGASAPWTHIVMTVDGAKTDDGTEPGEHDALATLYVNGKKVGSGNVQNEKGKDMKTYFGVTGWKNDGYFKGLVDELVFTNDVLTEEEAEAYYLDSIENTGNAIRKITAVSADDGEEVTVAYGTSLNKVKDMLKAITYKAAAGEGDPIELKPISDSLTVDDYTVTTTGEVETTVKLQAPDSCLFDMNGGKSLTITRIVKIKVLNPVTITAITPSAATVPVPYGSTEDEIKAELAKLTFTVTTDDDSDYEISNETSKWTLSEATNGSRTATFAPGDLEVGYKYADDLAPVTVTVTETPAISITGLTVDSNTLKVAYRTSETGVKAELAKLEFKPTVAEGETAPVIANTAELWTIVDYNGEEAGDYTAKATVKAPTGYAFANGVSAEVTVKVTVKPQGQHVLSSIIVETPATKTKYIEGDKFDKTGMVVKAGYEDGASEDVTSKVTIVNADVKLALTDKSVSISYSEGEGDAARIMTATQTISVVKVEEGMASHYGFDGDLKDSVGKSKTGKTVRHQALTETTVTDIYSDECIKGQSFKSNADNAVEVPESFTADQKAFTINLWVRTSEGTTNYAPILQGKSDNAQYGKGLVLYANPNNNANKVELQVSNATNATNSKSFDLPMNKWTMITFVNANNSMEFYLDGKKQTLTATEKQNFSVAKGFQRLILSGGQWDTSHLVGNMDEVSIYDSSLDEDQVDKLYKSFKPTITGISVNAPKDGLLFSVSAVEDTTIQDALKKLEISATTNFGDVPVFNNDQDWTLDKEYNGVGTYTATKELTIPEGYLKAPAVSATLKVTITVENIALASIAVTTPPSKIEYIVGEEFDPSGMKVTATYDNDSTKDVTDEVTITNGTALPPADSADSATQEVSISYKEGREPVTITQEITVYTAKAAMLKARIANYTFDGTLENSVDPSKEGKVMKDGNNSMPTNSTETPNYQAESKHGQSILFNATSARIGIKLAESIASTKKDFTLNLWVRPEDGSTNWGEIVCGCGNPPWNKQLMIYVSPESKAGSGNFNLQGTGGAGETNLSFPDGVGKWAMLTWVNTADGATFYVNGVEQTVVDGLGTTAGIDNLFIGVGGWGDYFKGYIDEVSLYDKSLTKEQVGLLLTEFDAEDAGGEEPPEETPEETP